MWYFLQYFSTAIKDSPNLMNIIPVRNNLIIKWFSIEFSIEMYKEILDDISINVTVTRLHKLRWELWRKASDRTIIGSNSNRVCINKIKLFVRPNPFCTRFYFSSLKRDFLMKNDLIWLIIQKWLKCIFSIHTSNNSFYQYGINTGHIDNTP